VASGASDGIEQTPGEFSTLQERLKAVTDAYQTLKSELVPRVAEAQVHV
jgi:hypothetical protein